LVTLDVLLIEHQTEGEEYQGAASQTAAALLELEKQGKLDSVTRVRLSSVGGRKALVQLGERVPVETARNRGGFGGRGGEGGFTSSYTFEQIGTLISATPRVEEGGGLVVDVQVERSRLADVPKTSSEAQQEDPIARRKIVSLVCQSTVRLKPGEPTLVDSYQTAADKQATGEFVIVTAKVDAEGAKQAAAERQVPIVRAFPLVAMQAQEVTALLEKVVNNKDVRIAADAVANRVIASGAAEPLQGIAELLQRLDESKK
jgi:type II secretory pathway component GspD/PulD (secretin)